MAISSVYVDQAATFKQAVLVQVDPKLAYQSDQQEKTRDGVPQWVAQVMVKVENFGRETNEVIKVSIASHKNPAEDIPPFSPLRMHGLAANVYDASRKNRDTNQREVTGAGVSFRCDRLESAMRQMKAAS